MHLKDLRKEKLVIRLDKRCEGEGGICCLWLSKQAGCWTPLLSRDWTKILCRVGVRVGD